jgi:hypothetical protein
MTDHLSPHARKVLAESALHRRACEILGIHAIEETDTAAYSKALMQADREGAGARYVEEIVKLSGVHATEAKDEGELDHRSAVSFLRATGKSRYSPDEYVAAVNLVRGNS